MLDGGARNRDKVVDIQNFWKSKRRSVPPSEHSNVCTQHRNQRKVVETTSNLLHKANVYASPATVTFSGKFSDPPNPDQKQPHPHKRYNMEYRSHNLVTGYPTNTDCFNFYRNN